MKKVTQLSATKVFNLGLNNNLCDWTEREQLFYKWDVFYIHKIQDFWMKLLKNHRDNPLKRHQDSKTTYNTPWQKYFQLNMYK